MSTDTERLFVQLEGRITDFEKKMAQAERRGTRTYTSLQRGSRTATRRMETDMVRSSNRINAALASTTAAVGSLNSVMMRVGGPVVGAAMFAGLIRGARRAVSEFSDLGKAARDVAVDVEELQGIQRGFARESRISTDDLTAAMERFNRRVGEAVNGSGPLNTTVERYGIVLRNANGELRTQGELLREVANTIRAARTEQERAAIAQAAFGDVGRRMAQTLAGGSDAIDRMIREAREAGHVIDSDLIQRAEELDDRFDDLTRNVSTFFRTIMVNAADTLVRLSDVRLAFEDLLRASEGRTREAVGEGLAGALDEEGFRRAAEAVGEFDRAVVQMRAQAQATIQHLDAFAENLAMIGDQQSADQMEDLADRMTEIIERFDSGSISANQFTEEMDGARGEAITLVNALADVDAQGFEHVRRNVLALHDLLRAAVGAARELAAAANAAVPEAGLERRRQDGAQREREAQLVRDREALQDFLEEQGRLAGRTREQIALEAELQAVQRAARGEGITLTREQAEEQARLNLQLRGDASPTGGGRGGRGGGQDEFARAVAAIRERTAALEAEAVALASAAGSGREYGQAIRYAYERARLLTAAQRDGLAITPELEAAIDSLADAYTRAGNAADEAADQMRRAQDNAERGAHAMADLFGSMLQGGDAATAALARLLAQLAQVQMQKAMLGLSKSGGGFFGWLGGMLSLSGGGYTGNAPADQVAGVVHGGEYVFSKPAVDRIGLSQLESMHRGYRSGGHVAPARAMPGPGGGEQRFKVDVGVSVDNAGALTAYVKRVVKEDAPAIARQVVGSATPQIVSKSVQATYEASREFKLG
ncbi:MAG: hypothetical protein JJU15_00450 [Pararhodobacter sp.]|nr:hypothetical protein [Pararhodobacter sp.]